MMRIALLLPFCQREARDSENSHMELAFNSRAEQGSNGVLLTSKPPGHADDQQDDRPHQQNGDECDEAIYPEGNVVCN